MANANSSSQQRELAVKGGGLIVQCAFYGALKRAIVPYLDIEDQAVGPIIDVTVPVQVMVDRSRLFMEEGESKAVLQGFFDPCAAAIPYDAQVSSLFLSFSPSLSLSPSPSPSLPLPLPLPLPLSPYTSTSTRPLSNSRRPTTPREPSTRARPRGC